MYYFLLFGQTFSIIASADRFVRYGPSCPRAELYGYEGADRVRGRGYMRGGGEKGE